MIQREPKAVEAVAEPPIAPIALEEVNVKDVDVHTLVGPASFVLFPEDRYSETPKEIKITLARNGENLVFQKENVGYVSIRPRVMMRPKAAYKPKGN